MVLGWLLALPAIAVGAQPKAPDAPLPKDPTAAPRSTPIDLTLHPSSASQSILFDHALRPPTVRQWSAVDPALHLSTAPQWSPIDSALHPTTAPQWSPIGSALLPSSTPPAVPIDPSLPTASAEVQRVARWVGDTHDNAGLPYLLIDKVNAQVYAFSPAGQLQGTAPALLGMARGDRLLAANDTRMAAMTPQVRITPAGRFVSRLAIDSHGKELLVLDYDASISLHAVVKGTPLERRAERLNSPTSQDNRISFGCINVPTSFYATIVSPSFAHTKGVVYVLPETGPASDLFGIQSGVAPVSGAPQASTVMSARSVQTVQAPDARKSHLTQ